MLAIVPVTLIFLGISALLAGVIPAVLTLAESERMTESTTGTICEITPHLIMEPHWDSMDMTANHPWATLQVMVAVDTPAKTEGENGTQDETKLSVWVPEWYGPVEVGETISLVYDPSSLNTCLVADVREVLEEVMPMFAKSGVALVVIGSVTAIALAVMGLV